MFSLVFSMLIAFAPIESVPPPSESIFYSPPLCGGLEVKYPCEWPPVAEHCTCTGDVGVCDNPGKTVIPVLTIDYTVYTYELEKRTTWCYTQGICLNYLNGTTCNDFLICLINSTALVGSQDYYVSLGLCPPPQ